MNGSTKANARNTTNTIAAVTYSFLRQLGRPLTLQDSAEQPDLADDEVAALLDSGSRGPSRAKRARPFPGARVETHARPRQQDDVAPAHAAAPAGAQGLAGRL